MSRRCRVCGRKLRDPLARARGVGPTCSRRLGLTPSRRCATVLVPSTRAVPAGTVHGQLELFSSVGLIPCPICGIPGCTGEYDRYGRTVETITVAGGLL